MAKQFINIENLYIRRVNSKNVPYRFELVKIGRWDYTVNFYPSYKNNWLQAPRKQWSKDGKPQRIIQRETVRVCHKFYEKIKKNPNYLEQEEKFKINNGQIIDTLKNNSDVSVSNKTLVERVQTPKYPGDDIMHQYHIDREQGGVEIPECEYFVRKKVENKRRKIRFLKGEKPKESEPKLEPESGQMTLGLDI